MSERGTWVGGPCASPGRQAGRRPAAAAGRGSLDPPPARATCPAPPADRRPASCAAACRVSLSAMPREQRAVVHALAEQYGLATTGYGQEPARYVELFKTPAAGIPARLLSRCGARWRGVGGAGMVGVVRERVCLLDAWWWWWQEPTVEHLLGGGPCVPPYRPPRPQSGAHGPCLRGGPAAEGERGPPHAPDGCAAAAACRRCARPCRRCWCGLPGAEARPAWCHRLKPAHSPTARRCPPSPPCLAAHLTPPGAPPWPRPPTTRRHSHVC